MLPKAHHLTHTPHPIRPLTATSPPNPSPPNQQLPPSPRHPRGGKGPAAAPQRAALLEYHREEDAEAAIYHMAGYDLDGVCYPPPHPPTPKQRS